MILKLTTNQKAEVWVNLDQIIQMTTITVGRARRCGQDRPARQR
jgi:hypothetical protein